MCDTAVVAQCTDAAAQQPGGVCPLAAPTPHVLPHADSEVVGGGQDGDAVGEAAQPPHALLRPGQRRQRRRQRCQVSMGGIEQASQAAPPIAPRRIRQPHPAQVHTWKAAAAARRQLTSRS